MNRESATSTIPHGSPDNTTGPTVCSPSRAKSATSIGSNIAITTAANRNENRDRRGSGEANTPPTRTPIGMASTVNTTTTTFMRQSYQPT
jgi:hypothetical protein